MVNSNKGIFTNIHFYFPTTRLDQDSNFTHKRGQIFYILKFVTFSSNTKIVFSTIPLKVSHTLSHINIYSRNEYYERLQWLELRNGNNTTMKHNRDMIENTISRERSINCKNIVLAQINYLNLK